MVDADIEAAIRADDVAVLQGWLDAGGDALSVTADGQSLLSLAARHGSLRAVDALLAVGVPADAFGVWPGALVEAVEAGHAEVVDRLLAAGADVGSAQWHEDVDLPLLSAVRLRRWPIADRLLAAGAVAKSDPRWLPEVLAAALEASGSQRSRFVAAFLAAAEARLGAALPIPHRLLAKAASLLRKDAASRDLVARISSTVDAVRALEEEVVDLYAERERPEEALARIRAAAPDVRAAAAGALLPFAASDQRWPLVDELLALAGSLVDCPDPLGRSALTYAARRGNTELVRRLLDLGARLRALDLQQESVADWARLGLHADVVELVEERMRSTAGPVDGAADARLMGATAEERTAEASRLAVEAASEGRWDRVEELLGRGADVNGAGRRGRTLLMYAVGQADRQRVEWLVESGADLDAVAERGETVDGWARMADTTGDMERFLQELRAKRS